MKSKVTKITALLTAFILCIIGTMSVNASANSEIFDKFNETSVHLSGLDTPIVSSIGGEWMIIGLSRADKISYKFKSGYYKNVENYVKNKGSAQLHRSKSTDNSRVIIALTSIGKDVTDVSGYNLLEPLADFNYVKKQGINGPVWALTALDTVNYQIPVNYNVAEQTTRKKLIDYILNNCLDDGGWALSANAAEPDITGMAIQSLAPYYKTDDAVKTAVDRAVNVLSNLQNRNGGYSDCESCAQVITALTGLGINPHTDERFIKNGNSLIDALMSFSVENGFSHVLKQKYDQIATEQAYYALVSYIRLIENKTSLYDMSDLKDKTDVFKDINSDGIINVNDCTYIQKYIVKLVTFTPQQINDSDCNCDGCVDVSDVTLMQKYLVHLY